MISDRYRKESGPESPIQSIKSRHDRVGCVDMYVLLYQRKYPMPRANCAPCSSASTYQANLHIPYTPIRLQLKSSWCGTAYSTRRKPAAEPPPAISFHTCRRQNPESNYPFGSIPALVYGDHLIQLILAQLSPLGPWPAKYITTSHPPFDSSVPLFLMNSLPSLPSHC